MAIDASKVKELRERTGLPMMECKKALVEADGDVDKAQDNLRKAGAKTQEKLAGREAKEGRVATYTSDDGKVGALVAIRCETEPVANNEQFQAFADAVVQVVASENPADADALGACALPGGGTVASGLTDLINSLRENISVGSFRRFENDAVAQYLHFDNKKAAMIALKGNSTSDEKVGALGKDLCMHVVFSQPKALAREDLDPAFVEKEKEIKLAQLKADPKNAKKPEEILEKIITGQMNKLYQENCFLEQAFIKDEKGASVADSVKNSGTGVTVEQYVYIATDA